VRSRCAVVAVLVYAMFAERVFLSLSTAGKGLLLLLPILLPIVLLAVSWRTSRVQNDSPRRKGLLTLSCLYAGLVVILPILGVLLGRYTLNSLVSALPGIVILSVLYGIARNSNLILSNGFLGKYVLCGIVIEATFATIQFLFREGIELFGLGTLIAEWDVYVQLSYGPQAVLAGRSIGTFINPNHLGLWSALSIGVGFIWLRGFSRVAGVGLSLLSLVLSQSRGSLLAVIVAFVAYGLWMAYRTVPRKGGAWVLPVLSLGVLSVGMLLLVFLEDRILDLLGERYKAPLTGFHQELSVSARFEGWAEGLDYWRDNPHGTLGSPHMFVLGVIDSDYLYALLQGGIPLLAALCLVLMAGVAALADDTPEGRCLGIASMVVLVNGLTASTMCYSASSVFWLIAALNTAGITRSASQNPAVTVAAARAEALPSEKSVP
jgi:hypothetical protein